MPQTATTEEAGLALAGWTRSIKRSALQDMLVASARPGILSFALGLPAAELFPAADYSEAVARVLSTDPRALQYGPPFRPLKQHVVSLMRERGVECREEQVFLTAGAQQGVNLLARLLLEPGSKVVVEEVAYTGCQQVLRASQADILTVPTDAETGVDVGAVERLLESGVRPAMLYVVPDGHNPLAVSLSREKRVRLAELARAYRMPIIEDDPYGFLYYETPPPPLRAFEDQWVLYVGTFSKIMAPALRTGWVVVPESLIPHLAIIKEASDIDMAPLSQRAISAYLDAGHLPAHLDNLRREYRRRRDAMLGALRTYFPAGARWETPTSGLFIWVELPEGADTGALLAEAIETEQVAFIPGHAFHVGDEPPATNRMRLNFSNSSVERIEEGVRRLARVLSGGLAPEAGARRG
ncbi:MAG TPA: PLP-dependent aminotransferase family protein [Pyrinomonadaceae bacterium]|nr:PLP-dependent aminotransferase family protein [Pyrinomonadaceae bacterium]